MSNEVYNSLNNTYIQNQIYNDSSTSISASTLNHKYLCDPFHSGNINITLPDSLLTANYVNQWVDFYGSPSNSGTTTLIPQSGTINGLSSVKLGKNDYVRVNILNVDNGNTFSYSISEDRLAPVEFNVVNTVTTAIPAGSVTVVPFDTIIWNEGDAYDGTDTLNFTGIPGFISINCQLTFSPPVTGSPLSLYVYKNGSNVKQIFNQIGAIQSTLTIDYSDYSNGSSSSTYQIRVFQNQTGGADLNILTANLIGRRTSRGE